MCLYMAVKDGQPGKLRGEKDHSLLNFRIPWVNKVMKKRIKAENNNSRINVVHNRLKQKEEELNGKTQLEFMAVNLLK